MIRPRLSIGWSMFGIAMLCVVFALLGNAPKRRPLTGYSVMSDMALWPTLTAFGGATYSILKNRGRRPPFLWGFAAVGWGSVLVYLAICFWVPRAVEVPIIYYLNEVDYWWIVRLIDSDTHEGYMLNMLVLGLLLAAPQLMMATVGGLIARWIWGARWNTT